MSEYRDTVLPIVRLAAYGHERLDMQGLFNKYFDRSMSKMKMTKGLLMTALITGSVMWGGDERIC